MGLNGNKHIVSQVTEDLFRIKIDPSLSLTIFMCCGFLNITELNNAVVTMSGHSTAEEKKMYE